MKFTVDRDTLLKPLQTVLGVVERRQSLPVLANVLLQCKDDEIAITGTDMELELVARVDVSGADEGEATLPARKLNDICRNLPADARVELSVDGEKATLRSGRSRFSLSTLPADEFPNADAPADGVDVSVPQGDLKRLIELTQFAMAQQDVRYYLNGLLLETSDGELRAVATDGHRLALAEMAMDTQAFEDGRQLIVPRKAVGELQKLLGNGEDLVTLTLGSNTLRVTVGETVLTSKLVDGRFPDYRRVVPDEDRCDKVVSVDRDLFRQCLMRASILSNEKYRAVRLNLEKNALRVTANNPEQEEAQDEVEVEYSGEELEVGFNVTYLTDALAAVPGDTARLFMSDATSSCLIRPTDDGTSCRYVVMPMRL